MPKNLHRGPSHRLQRVPKSRRPPDVSRRQRKKRQHLKKLGFETLEDRRVMSAQSPLADLEMVSYSSATPEGQLQIFLQELERYGSQTGAAPTAYVTNSIPSDPLRGDQWHLINTGQQVGNPDFQTIFGVPGEDINVAPAWQLGYTGAGVVVAVIDSGTETAHPDLAANIHPLLQLDAIDQDGDANPRLLDPGNAHGTAVAGIIASVADNGLGGSGIAPNAQIVPIRLIDPGANFTQSFEDASIDTFRYETDQIDITNNSWGPQAPLGDPQRFLDGPSPAQVLALRDSVIFGRDGLGVIHVFAAGNHAGAPVLVDPVTGDHEIAPGLDTSSYNGWVNSRYTIGVTGVDHDGEYNNIDGTVTGYPETGASVFVAAPTGSHALNIVEDTGIGSGIVTTDLTGEDGRNIAPDPDTGEEFDRDFLLDTDYTSRFNGTSASAPMVSGVIALMLEANPNLTWRDVQEILVRSARQNAEFATQADGFDITQGIEQPNSWIINQTPLFSDPDIYDPTIPAGTLIERPTLDLNLTSLASGVHYAPIPQVLTTAAGYTISQGLGSDGEMIGYAHGVIDAEAAVLLAEQWHTKGQALPPELTFTTTLESLGAGLPAFAVVAATGFGVPGGMFGESGFIDYWNEYYVDDPFADFVFTAARGRPLELTVPDSNAMTIETIEVHMEISGGTAAALDGVRMVLVSPGGTFSDLNHYQSGGGAVDNGGNLDFTFSTNRSWGERSDDAIIIDPVTAEPIIDTSGSGGNQFNFVPGSAGDLITRGWQLHFENYSSTDLTVDSLEIAWHGSPIEAATQRVQGLVGVDDNEDDLFNFSRVIPQSGSTNGVVRLGDVTNTIDTSHESMGANVTVFAHRDGNNNGVLDGSDVLVDQFVTGADGNYYFDLVPDTYIFSIDDEAERTAVDDTLTPAGFLKNFQSQWRITPDFFKVWDYDTNLEVPLQAATNAPFSFSGTAIPYHVNHINFLLDPGPPVAPQVDFSGTVFADVNGDGIFNGTDVAVPGVGVFGDVNRNGELDSGEILVNTGADGQYMLTVPTQTANVINVGVRPPANWTFSNPADGYKAFFVEPGMTVPGEDFHIVPPSVSTGGDGSALSGIILGAVFNDSNQDGVRQSEEVGVPNQTVYIDMNNSEAIDAGDVVTQTNSNGGYAFADLADGSHFVRIDLSQTAALTQTFPVLGFPQVANIVAGGTVVAADFGISSGATGGVLDFGDLPDVYGTRLIDNGARHPEGIYFLGSIVDSEADGVPTSDASGDDAFLPDEDGVDLVGGMLMPDGSTTVQGTLMVIASRDSGFLQAWFDYDNDDSFDDTVDGVFEQVVVNELLNAGVNTVTFDIPATITGSTVYARFRFGEYGLGSTGLALAGEVEDYQYTVFTPGPIPGGQGNEADFNDDGIVNGLDFLSLQRSYGMTAGATSEDGDANDDGQVDATDLAEWQAGFGEDTNPAPVIAPVTGDFDLDGNTDGSDFLAWQRGHGIEEIATLEQGDGTQDGNVDGEDLAIWTATFGTPGVAGGSGSPVVVASLSRSVAAAPVPSTQGLPPVAGEVSSSLVETTLSSASTLPPSDVPGPSRFIAQAGQWLQLDGNRISRLERSLFTSRVVARHENAAEAKSGDAGGDLVELGIAQRDLALDSLFARRQRAWKHLHDELGEEESSPDAVALALSEEINWRVKYWG